MSSKDYTVAFNASLDKAQAFIPARIVTAGLGQLASRLLGVITIGSHAQQCIEWHFATTVNAFPSPYLQAIEHSDGDPEGGRDGVQINIVNSGHLLHTFSRMKDHAKTAAFGCRKGARESMVLTQSRMAMPAIESAL